MEDPVVEVIASLALGIPEEQALNDAAALFGLDANTLKHEVAYRQLAMSSYNLALEWGEEWSMPNVVAKAALGAPFHWKGEVYYFVAAQKPTWSRRGFIAAIHVLTQKRCQLPFAILREELLPQIKAWIKDRPQ